MTRDEVLSMPAGREMDALVAEKVMGWNLSLSKDIWCKDGECLRDTDDWSPSIDIAAAWELVEKFAHNHRNNLAVEMGFSHFSLVAYPGGEWFCSLGLNDCVAHSAKAETAPLVICRASLIAILEAK